jgi:hypothetical protein
MAAGRIESAADLDVAWLEARLGARVASLSLRAPERATAGTLYFLDAPPLGELALKVYHPDSFDAGLNEAVLYQEVGGEIPAPRCHDLLIDFDRRYCHLLFDSLAPSHRPMNRLMQPDELDGTLCALAALHGRFWGDARLDAPHWQVPHGGTVRMIQALPRAGLEAISLWLLDEVIPTFVEGRGEILPPGWLPLFEAAAASWPDLYGERLAGGRDRTLVHGDCHWENVFVPRAGGGPPLFIDWECAKVAPAAYDVAYLLIAARSTAQRRELEPRVLERYRALLDGRYSREALEADYRLAVVANVFVALAWNRVQAMNDAMSAFLDWDCAALVT